MGDIGFVHMARIDIDTIQMGTRDRALNVERLREIRPSGLRADRGCGSSDGAVDGSQTFTAVTYKPENTPWQARRLTGRGFMMMPGGACHLPRVPYIR